MTLAGGVMHLGRRIKLLYERLLNKSLKTGKGVIIDFNTNIILKNNTLFLGNNIYLRSKKRGYQAAMPFPTTILIDIPGAEISIGDGTRINGAYIHAQQRVNIGKNCVIASGVQIMDSNGHEFLSANRTQGRDKPKEINIGDNVWIGLNAIILKGTKIGNNSVISAGSIVKGTFPENSLIVGNPAKAVKRFTI